MFIDKRLIEIAEEFKFKIGSNKIFGVLNNQYISIQRDQSGYSIIARVLQIAHPLLEGFNHNQGIRKAVGLKNARVEFGRDHLIINGISGHIFPSKTNAKLIETATKLTNLLEQHQKFSSAKTEETILIEGVPGPNDDSTINAIEDSLAQEAAKPIDHQAGLYFGLLLGFVIGFLLGAVSWMMQKYANSDLNPLGKGLVSVGLAVKTYTKFAGGLNRKSRFIVTLIALGIYLTWDIFNLYFQYYDKVGIELEAERLFEIYKNHFFNMSTFGKLAVVAIVTILLSTLFLIKETDKKKVSIEEGDSYEKARKVKKAENCLGLLFLAGLILSFVTAILPTTIYDSFEYISLKKLFYIGLIALVPAMYMVNKVLKGLNSSGPSLLPFKEKLVYFFLLLSLSSFISVSSAFVASYFNLALDESSPKTHIAEAAERLQLTKNICGSIEFTSKSFSSFEHRVCKPEANLLEKGVKAEIKVRQGFFSIPYILEMKFPNLRSFEAYTSTGRREKEFRSNVINHFYEYDKSEFFETRIKQWESNCFKSSGYECRLIAYVYEIKNEEEKALQLLKRSCPMNDPISCRGIILNSSADKSDKLKAKKRLINECEDGNDSYCMELVWTYWGDGYEIHRLEISRILRLSCKRGYLEACKILEAN